VLSRYSGVLGLWRSIGDGPVGSFFQFRWAQSCIEGDQLVYHSPLRCARHDVHQHSCKCPLSANGHACSVLASARTAVSKGP